MESETLMIPLTSTNLPKSYVSYELVMEQSKLRLMILISLNRFVPFHAKVDCISCVQEILAKGRQT